MSDDHSARAGSLQAHLTSVMMEIDDDDEDIIMVVVDVVNESAFPLVASKQPWWIGQGVSGLKRQKASGPSAQD